MKQSKPLMRARSSLIFHPSSLRPGFTLTEVLIVIGIIVLVLALAVPALDIISGSRSINGAENQVSAMLGRVRANAIGVERDTGVFFFIDPATERVTLAEVQNVSESSSEPILLDIVADRDFLTLPKGVGMQLIDNADFTVGTPPERADDGYIGFNNIIPSEPNDPSPTRYGGVILFDSKGRLVSKAYGFLALLPSGENTQIFNVIWTGKTVPSPGDVDPPDVDLIPPTVVTVAPNNVTRSAFGLILFDLEAFLNNGDHEDPQVAIGTNNYAGANGDIGEETWLDQNSVPLMINRYNGTLVRGE